MGAQYLLYMAYVALWRREVIMLKYLRQMSTVPKIARSPLKSQFRLMEYKCSIFLQSIFDDFTGRRHSLGRSSITSPVSPSCISIPFSCGLPGQLHVWLDKVNCLT